MAEGKWLVARQLVISVPQCFRGFLLVWPPAISDQPSALSQNRRSDGKPTGGAKRATSPPRNRGSREPRVAPARATCWREV